jgi:hypothetical protein
MNIKLTCPRHCVVDLSERTFKQTPNHPYTFMSLPMVQLALASSPCHNARVGGTLGFRNGAIGMGFGAYSKKRDCGIVAAWFACAMHSTCKVRDLAACAMHSICEFRDIAGMCYA